MLPGLCLSLALGIGLGCAWRLPCLPLLITVGVGVLFSPLWVRRPLLILLWAVLSGGLIGAASVAAVLREPPEECHVSRFTSRELVRLQGVIREPPVISASGQRYLLTAELLMFSNTAAKPICGQVELYRPPATPRLWPGTRVVIRGRLKRSDRSQMPGTPSAGLRRQSHNIGALLFADAQALVVLELARPSFLQRARLRIKALIDRAIRLDHARAIVTAILLGERGELGPDLRNHLARAGVSHVLAVSGLHLSLVTVALLVLLRGLFIRITWLSLRTDPRRIAALFAVVAAIIYTLLTGAAPSIVRACVMVCSCLLGVAMSREPDLVRPLALAGLCLLTWDPLLLLRPSFQLSFAAVVGIALVVHQRQGVGRKWSYSLFRWIGNLAATTLAATLITAPLVAHHFQQVSLAGIFCNLLVIPFCSFVLLPLSLAGAAAGVMSETLGLGLLFVAGGAADLLLDCCRLVSRVPLAAFDLYLNWQEALAFCIAAVALLSRGTARIAAMVIALLLLITSWGPKLMAQFDPPLNIFFLDVGQGDSTFLRFPTGATMLIDGGGGLTPSFDPGRSRVVPFLKTQAVRRLDYVVVSHPHPDHIQGLQAVIETFAVGELWICWHGEHDPWLSALKKRAGELGIQVVPPRVLQQNQLRIEPLWPRPFSGFCADPDQSGNDNSLVLRITYGRASVLMTGDIERGAERKLVELHRTALHVQLLKVPHHGSASSSTREFLDAVSPKLAVVSCGVDNFFGFPAGEVLQRYAQRHISLARIDQQGTIKVSLWSNGRFSWRQVSQFVRFSSAKRQTPLTYSPDQEESLSRGERSPFIH